MTGPALDPRCDIGLLRLVAQRLAGPRCASPAAAVRWMTALQAQDLAGALTAVALRTARGTRADVTAALDAGQVVRSWPMRGTLHLVPAEDLVWMLSLTGARTAHRYATRRGGLGLDEATLVRARRTAEAALSDRPLGRPDLLARWRAAGIPTDGQRAAHLLLHLAVTGVLCWGPMAGRTQQLVLLEAWVPAPRRLDRDEALGEWALRYLSSHGPATVADLARWTGLTLGDARRGVAVARPHLARLEVDGVEHLLDPATPDLLARSDDARRVLLLPGFDELVLGYGDRSAVLAPEHASRVVPGGNGMFLPTVVSQGRVVGVWKRGRTAAGEVSAAAFTSFAPGVAEAVAQVAAALP